MKFPPPLACGLPVAARPWGRTRRGGSSRLRGGATSRRSGGSSPRASTWTRRIGTTGRRSTRLRKASLRRVERFDWRPTEPFESLNGRRFWQVSLKIHVLLVVHSIDFIRNADLKFKDLSSFSGIFCLRIWYEKRCILQKIRKNQTFGMKIRREIKKKSVKSVGDTLKKSRHCFSCFEYFWEKKDCFFCCRIWITSHFFCGRLEFLK